MSAPSKMDKAPDPAPAPLFSVKHASELTPRTRGLYLIKGVLPARAIAQMIAQPNEGKTAVAMDLALHVALGRAWRGHRSRQGVVVYVALEAPDSAENRVVAWCQRNDVQRDNLPFILMHGRLDLRDDATVATFIAELFNIERRHGVVRLIIIDTQARATPGADENSSQDISRMLNRCGVIQGMHPDACLLLVHHMGKDSTRGARGHSSQLAAMDAVFEIANRELRIAKSRDGARDGVFAFDLVGEDLGEDEDGDQVSAVVAIEVDAPVRPKGQARRLSEGSRIALRALRDALAAEGTAVHPMAAPAGSKAVRLDVWRNYHRRKYGGDNADSESSAAQRMAWRRALDQLQAAGIVSVDCDWVLANDKR